MPLLHYALSIMPIDDSFDYIWNKRYNEVFKELVDEYIDTGEPVGSRTLSKRMDNALSPATIRNVMADLEELGILCSAHTSSGRKPTEKGWRYFVNTFIEVSTDLQSTFSEEINFIEDSKNTNSILEKTSEMLSHLSNCASIIMSPAANNKTIRYIDFISLSKEKVLVIILLEDGSVENRLISMTNDITNTYLEKAVNYLNSQFCGHTLSEIADKVNEDFTTEKNGLDEVTNNIIMNGLGMWSGKEEDIDNNRLIIKGHSNLLSNVEEIENIKSLLNKLDEKRTVKMLLDEALHSHGIQVFIGSENKAFNLAGCSMIISPYMNSKSKIIGAIGVIGPERMRYNKLINLVDFTAKMLGKII